MQNDVDNYHSYLLIHKPLRIHRTQSMRINISIGSIGSGQHKTLGVHTGQPSRNEIINDSS